MRLRDKNNAASVTSVIVTFVLVGCLIAVYGVVAEFETDVQKFGLVAYVFIAGPLFLAALIGPMTTTAKHKSFRSTLPSYLDGKRVKPRVQRVVRLFSFALGLLFLGSIALVLAVTAFVDFGKRNDPRAAVFRVLFFYGTPVALYVAARILLTRLFARLGWLTPTEAHDLAWMGKRYPPSFLEPFEEDE